MWACPKVQLGRPSPSPLHPRTPPPHQSVLPPHCQKIQGRQRERVGREGLWLEGRVLQLQWGDGGDLPKGSLGRTHIWGLSNLLNQAHHFPGQDTMNLGCKGHWGKVYRRCTTARLSQRDPHVLLGADFTPEKFSENNSP